MLFEQGDLVSIRGIYSDEYRREETKEEEETEEKRRQKKRRDRRRDGRRNKKRSAVEYQLYGRYDYSIDIMLEDFIHIRHILMICKQDRKVNKEILEQLKSQADKMKLGENAQTLIKDIFQES